MERWGCPFSGGDTGTNCPPEESPWLGKDGKLSDLLQTAVRCPRREEAGFWNAVQGQKTTLSGSASETVSIHPAAVFQLGGVSYLDELLLVINQLIVPVSPRGRRVC